MAKLKKECRKVVKSSTILKYENLKGFPHVGCKLWISRFITQADRKVNSMEILKAIAALSDSFREAVRILKKPTKDEIICVWELVTIWDNQNRAANDFKWGEAGRSWADALWKRDANEWKNHDLPPHMSLTIEEIREDDRRRKENLEQMGCTHWIT